MNHTRPFFQSNKPRLHSRKKGQLGEQLAVQYLLQHDYSLWDTNWHCHRGEIDIIARKGRHLAFIEVKSRLLHENSIDSLDAPQENFDAIKENKVHSLTALYLDRTTLRLRRERVYTYSIDLIALSYRLGWFSRPTTSSLMHTQGVGLRR